MAEGFIEMHQQEKRPNASVTELSERLCTHSQALKVVTSRSSRGATKIFLARTGVRCKKEHVSARHRLELPAFGRAPRDPARMERASLASLESIEDLAVVFKKCRSQQP